MGNTGGRTDYYHIVLEDENNGFNDTLFFPHQENVSNCGGYWLASPGAEEYDNMMNVLFDSTIYMDSLDRPDIGVRPLVSLLSEVSAKQDANGIWKLSV